MNAEIEAMKEVLLGTIADLGGMVTNLQEATDWAKDERTEEALLSLEAVAAGAEDAHAGLRKIALTCTQLSERKAVTR